MNDILLPCLCGFGLLVGITLPLILIKKGFDFVFGCLGNGLVLLITGILLAVFIAVTELNICQVWLVGEPICSILHSL